MPNFKCSVCGETFDNAQELEEHENEAHAKENVENYECNECGERFESAADLQAHMAAAHSGG